MPRTLPGTAHGGAAGHARANNPTAARPSGKRAASGPRISGQSHRQRGFLPRPVPEKDQFDEGVCEIHQSGLGNAGDPKPVVQDVQVHVVGCGYTRLASWMTPSGRELQAGADE